MILYQKHRKNEIHLNNIFFLIGLLICCLSVFPQGYSFFNISIVFLIFAYYAFNNKRYLLNNKVKILEIFIFFFALFQIIFTSDISRVSIFVFYLILEMKEIYEPKQMKMYTKVMCVCFFAVLIAYFLFGFNIQFDKLSWNSLEKKFFTQKGLGFRNPNRCMLFFFYISCFILLLTSKIRWYFILAIINVLLYQYTQSRTFYYALSGLILLLIIFNVLKLENKKIFSNKLIIIVFLLGVVLSIVLPKYFSDTYLNALFTGRLSNNQKFIETGFSLFGNAKLENEVFDNSYLHMILTKGLLYFSAYVLVLVSAILKAKVDIKGFLILTVLFAVSYMEVIFLDYSTMMLIGFILFKEQSSGEHNIETNSLLLVWKKS